MRLVLPLMAIAVLSAPMSTNAGPVTSPNVIHYGCSDLVIRGKVKSLEFDHLDIEGDILGHGWITAEVEVRKLLYGSEPRHVIPIRYFARTYMRDDRDFLMVLAPAKGGRYEVRSARLREGPGHPTLAKSCE